MKTYNFSALPQELLAGTRELLPALDKVGKGFEKGSLFLPQLLMSAEAAKRAFGKIKEKLPPGAGGKAPSCWPR